MMMARVGLSLRTIVFSIVAAAAFRSLLAATALGVGSVGTKVLRPDGTANKILRNLLAANNATTQVVLEGYVTKRRAIGKSLVFLDIVPSSLPRDNEATSPDFESAAPVQAVLRREFWRDDGGGDTFNMFHKILQPGVHVELTGYAWPSRIPGEGMLFCRSAVFQIANSNPQHLRNVLRYAKDGFIDLDHVACALPGIEKGELLDGLLGRGVTCGELAARILSKVPRDMLLNPSHLMGATSTQKVALLPPVPHKYSNPLIFNIENIVDKQEAVSITTALESKQRTKERQLKEDTTSSSKLIDPFTLTGWVQNRRRFQDSVSVLELVDKFSSLASTDTVAAVDYTERLENDIKSQNDKLRELWKGRIYAVLHPGALNSGRSREETSITDPAVIYGNILCAGARVMLRGYLLIADSDSGEKKSDVATFWATKCRLLQSSWRPSTVRQLLDLWHGGKFGAEEAASALELPGGYAQAEDIARGGTEATDRRWMAAELTRSLQGENSRVGRVSTAMRSSLDLFAHVRDEYPLEEVDLTTIPIIDNTERAKVSTILSEGNSPRSPPEGSRWRRAKKPQLEWMVDQISAVLRSHPDFGRRRLKIVDIGGGKGLLSNLLAETFGNETVEVRVVDISTSATRNGMMRAKRRGLGNVRFDSRDATTLDAESGADVVVALHACGALSDVALGHAACRGAGFVVCPCCFRSNPHLRVSIPSDGGAELVTAEEWIGADSIAYEPLKRLAELQGDMNVAGRAMHTICGLRAAAVESRWRSRRFPEAEISTAIKSFPIGFSTRNLCLVGKYIAPYSSPPTNS